MMGNASEVKIDGGPLAAASRWSAFLELLEIREVLVALLHPPIIARLVLGAAIVMADMAPFHRLVGRTMR